MTIQVNHWENHLLDLAQQAIDSGVNVLPAQDQSILQNSYGQCETITRENSKTFFMASSLMPADKRQATRALYAFCRVSDDIVDHAIAKPFTTNSQLLPAAQPSTSEITADLSAWRDQVVHNQPQPRGSALKREVSLAWADARRRFRIPNGYVEQLIEGLTLDLKRVRYQSFSELSQYCYGVACTVGLMSMHITGYTSREAIPYAIRLGVALQLTNILRDVGEDWRAGRLYLPLDELAMFGLNEADVANGQVDDRWRAFMRYQIQRARRLYSESLPGVALLHPDGRLAITAAGELYRGILDQIEANDYDVFHQRAALSTWGKLRRMPGIWWRSRRAVVSLSA